MLVQLARYEPFPSRWSHHHRRPTTTAGPNHHHGGDDAKSKDDDNDVLNEVQKVVSFPEDFPMNQTRMFPEDQSVRDAVLRCLQIYLNQIQQVDEHPSSSLLKQAHLCAFKASSTLPSDSPEKLLSLEHRPQWDNIRAGYESNPQIESGISSRPLNPTRQPFESHPFPFHFDLTVHPSPAKNVNDGTTFEAGGESIAPSSEPKTVERVELPIDQYKETILDNIQQNRVTIIHGETGCAKSS
jgi:hypothetical protein